MPNFCSFLHNILLDFKTLHFVIDNTPVRCYGFFISGSIMNVECFA